MTSSMSEERLTKTLVTILNKNKVDYQKLDQPTFTVHGQTYQTRAKEFGFCEHSRENLSKTIDEIIEMFNQPNEGIYIERFYFDVMDPDTNFGQYYLRYQILPPFGSEQQGVDQEEESTGETVEEETGVVSPEDVLYEPDTEPEAEDEPASLRFEGEKIPEEELEEEPMSESDTFEQEPEQPEKAVMEDTEEEISEEAPEMTPETAEPTTDEPVPEEMAQAVSMEMETTSEEPLEEEVPEPVSEPEEPLMNQESQQPVPPPQTPAQPVTASVPEMDYKKMAKDIHYLLELLVRGIHPEVADIVGRAVTVIVRNHVEGGNK